MSNAVECCCQNYYGDLGQGLFHAFASVRECCPALKRILVPDEVWPDFQQWDRDLRDGDLHQSTLVLAMARGHLGQTTSAIHRYLMEGGVPRADIRPQYREDLQEKWMRYKDPKKRNSKSREFLGHLIELQCAEWLESQGWTITGLEALREGPDIEAKDNLGVATAFEVKFIGREDEDFVLMLNSLSDKQPTGRWASPYSPANFLLFRAYEATKQLQQIDCRRIAVLVILDATWGNFRLALSDNWINWHNPAFFDDGDKKWQEFLEKKRRRKRYAQVNSDLQLALRDLHEIWILRFSYTFNYAREFRLDMRTSA